MKIKVAIVGSGFGVYCLLPAFDGLKGCNVRSICAEKAERLFAYWRNRGKGKIYTDWKGMLEKEKPDAVAIAVVPKYQYEIARYALDNGIAVFAEKPLTTSVATSLQLCELAEEKNLPGMVDFLFPEIPEWAAAKAALERGLAGKILNVNVRWEFLSYDLKNSVKSWKTDVDEGGGALSFFFSHTLYYLEYFLGRIKTLQCVLSKSEKSLNGGESIVNMIILFESGCTGNAHMSISSIGKQQHSIEFEGEEGTLILQNENDNFVDGFELLFANQKRVEKVKVDNSFGLPPDAEDPRVRAVKPIAERFLHWCSTGVASKPDFRAGLRVQELIELARISNSEFRHEQKSNGSHTDLQ